MRKLLKKLNKWNFYSTTGRVILTKWQRKIFYEFIIEKMEEVKKENGK